MQRDGERQRRHNMHYLQKKNYLIIVMSNTCKEKDGFPMPGYKCASRFPNMLSFAAT